jgi:hypothetical protein
LPPAWPSAAPSTARSSSGASAGAETSASYALTQGSLPAGTSLSGLSLTGTFGGQPGYLQFTVQVSDGLGVSTTIAPTFWMYQHISLSNQVCYGNYNTGCSVQIPISGGVPGGTPSVALLANNANPAQGCWNTTPLAPPPGYVLTVSGTNVVVSIPPHPEPAAGGYAGIWTIQLTDYTYCAESTYCTSNQATVTIGVQCG